MKLKKSLSLNSVYYFFYQVLNLLYPFVSGIYVSRKLLPINIGQVAAAQNLVEYFVIFSFLGIPTYGMREIAKVRDNSSEKNKIFSELFFINLISTIFFLFIYLVIVFNVDEYHSNIKLYLIVGISVALNIFNISWLYEGLEEFKFISVRNFIFKIISLIALFGLVRTNEDYIYYALITVIGTAGNYIVNTIFLPFFVKLSFCKLNFRRHLKSIFYLVSVNLAIQIYSLMDITMMNFFCSKESIAFYKYGHSIEAMLLQILNTVTMVLVPRISYYYKEKNFREFNRLISKALKVIVILSVPMIVGIFFVADDVLTGLYGAEYIRSASILKIFSIVLIIAPIGYLLGSRVLLVTGHESKMPIAVCVGAFVNLVINFLLIPKYAEFGATIASVVSQILVMVVYIQLGKKYFKQIYIARTFLKVGVSVFFMGLFLVVIQRLCMYTLWKVIMQICGATFVYATLLIVSKEDVASEYANLVKKKFSKG